MFGGLRKRGNAVSVAERRDALVHGAASAFDLNGSLSRVRLVDMIDGSSYGMSSDWWHIGDDLRVGVDSEATPNSGNEHK